MITENLKYIKSIDENEANIFIYGEVGSEINGNEVAREIRIANSFGCNKINLRINSNGGSVIDGLSIIAAIIESEAEVNTYNDGIAASMAGVILSVGKNRYAYDYSRAMLHEPSIWGETIETIQDEKKKNGLLAIKSQLITILSNNMKKEESEVEEILHAETWYTAKEMKKHNLIDKIINTSKKIEKNISVDELMMLVTNEYKNQKTKDMEKIINYLKLNSEVTEDNVIEAIQNIETKLAEKEAELVTLKAENETIKADNKVIKSENEDLKAKVQVYKNDQKELNKKLAKEVVENAINDSKLQEKDKNEMIKIAENNIDNFKMILSNMKIVNPGSITNQIKKDVEPTGREAWTIRDWEKKDPKGLLNLKNENLDEYEKMFNTYYKK